jgi:hypothetical protein
MMYDYFGNPNSGGNYSSPYDAPGHPNNVRNRQAQAGWDTLYKNINSTESDGPPYRGPLTLGMVIGALVVLFLLTFL